MNTLLGMQVFESPYAVRAEPIRRHKKRANQSKAYHRRVQKKWTKRFGTREVACAFMIDTSFLGMGLGKVLVMHPKAFAMVRGLTL